MCGEVSLVPRTDARARFGRIRVDAFLISFGIIFVAELGDKSQLMAMALASRYRASTVLVAITLATASVHLLSVVLGAAAGAALPTDAVSVVAGVAFLIFAAWTLRGDELDDGEASRADRPTRSVLVTVIAAFSLAELGDKTMLATVTLASDNGLFGTWLGFHRRNGGGRRAGDRRRATTWFSTSGRVDQSRRGCRLRGLRPAADLRGDLLNLASGWCGWGLWCRRGG